MKSFCIIGLGNFGKNLALTLAQNGNQVLVIDNVESDIDAIADQVTNAVCGDPTNEMVLRAAGVTSYGCCVVCLGSDNMQESILVTLTLKELGIPKIVARASSEQHRKVLAKVGADKVVFPEKDMGQNLAYILSKTDVLEFINFSRNCSVVELKTPRRWAGSRLRIWMCEKNTASISLPSARRAVMMILKFLPIPTVCFFRRRRSFLSAATLKLKKLPVIENKSCI